MKSSIHRFLHSFMLRKEFNSIPLEFTPKTKIPFINLLSSSMFFPIQILHQVICSFINLLLPLESILITVFFCSPAPLRSSSVFFFVSAPSSFFYFVLVLPLSRFFCSFLVLPVTHRSRSCSWSISFPITHRSPPLVFLNLLQLMEMFMEQMVTSHR